MSSGYQKPPSVRMMLRESTHKHHAQLNYHPLLSGLTQSDYPLASYRKLLCAYFHIFRLLETKIQHFLFTQTSAFDYSERLKLPWLEKDLAFFEADPLVTLSAGQKPTAFPEIENAGQLIGVLYTIEGSTLGGQLISRRLAEHHGLTPGAGACFFNGYGEQTASMWQAFIHFSETIDGNQHLCQTAVQSACQAFQLFNHVLDDFTLIL